MLFADRLAGRVCNVLKKQVKDKGYEADAVLIKKEGGKGLGITDFGNVSNTLFSVPIKIVITAHDIEQFPMELGDNPDDILDFIWLPDNGKPPGSDLTEDSGGIEVDEGMTLRYLGNDYAVTAASPARIGENLIIKECRAKKLR